MEITALSTTDIGVIATLVLVIVVLAVLIFMTFSIKSSLEAKTHDNMDTTFRFKSKATKGDLITIEGEVEIKTQIGVVALKHDLTDKNMKGIEADLVITTKSDTSSGNLLTGDASTGNFRAYNKSDKTLVLEGLNFLPVIVNLYLILFGFLLLKKEKEKTEQCTSSFYCSS